ncbi:MULTISPECIES: D-alanine--D-alanine ligase family protein [Bacteria]|uniref:D-alanine--D-alanine ligase family protein n=1 Tax=Bacteria TaxID=2 RepID=UPI003C7C90F1
MSARIVVIGGGVGVEHEVSLASAAGVAEALERRGYVVDRLTIGRDGDWRSGGPRNDRALVPPAGTATGDHGAQRPGPSRTEGLRAALALIGAADAVFPAVHGPHGEDGALAALCELAGAPVVGSGLTAGAVGMDKHWSKLVAEHAGVRTAPGRLVGPRDLDVLTDIPTEDEPQVVKPVSSGSSHGVSLVRNEEELVAAIALACTVDAGAERGQGRALVEPAVRGREIDVAVLREPDGTRWAAPALEIHTAGLFDTATKYDGSARFSVPAVLDAREAFVLERAALAMFDALGCRGVARVDFFLTEDGPVFNEINTMPGLTPASQVPRMFAAAGTDYDELMHRLVQGALRR